MNVFSALHDIGFMEKTGIKLQYVDNKISLGGEMNFIKGENVIKLWVTSNEIHLSYNYDIQRNKWDEFVFCPNYTNFEEMNRSQINDYTEKLLNSLIVTGKFNQISSKYAFVSVNMNRCSEDNTLADKVYRRFYGIGTNFAPEESSENLKKWGDYKTGIAIITPVKLRDNFLRIEKIINYHLLKNINLTSQLTVCPLCGGTHIVSSGHQNYSCHDCHHNISITYCNVCDPNKKNPIIWVKYVDDKFLQREDVVRGDFVNNKIYDQMSKIEIIMGEKATTSFDLVKDTTGWKLKTLCPHCGIRLGESGNEKKE